VELALRLHVEAVYAHAMSGRDVLGRALALELALSPLGTLAACSTVLCQLGPAGIRGLELALRLHAVAVCAHALAGRDVLGRLMLALALELADSSSESLAAHRTSLELGVVGPRAPGTDLRRHGGVCVWCGQDLALFEETHIP